jgi:hypothetical protein
MKKIPVILLLLVTTWLFADEKDDWSFELAGAIGDIESSVKLIEKANWSIETTYLDERITKYIELLKIGLRNGYITQGLYDQKIEAVNAVKRRMLQVIGARSEGLGL